MTIEWASARVPPTPLLGVGLKVVDLYLTQSRPDFSVKLGSFRLSWLQLERSLDSAASSALPIDRPAQKDRAQFDISHPVIIIPFECLKPGKRMPQRRVLRV